MRSKEQEEKNTETAKVGLRLMDTYEALEGETDNERDEAYHWADAVAAILHAAASCGFDVHEVAEKAVGYLEEERGEEVSVGEVA